MHGARQLRSRSKVEDMRVLPDRGISVLPVRACSHRVFQREGVHAHEPRVPPGFADRLRERRSGALLSSRRTARTWPRLPRPCPHDRRCAAPQAFRRKEGDAGNTPTPATSRRRPCSASTEQGRAPGGQAVRMRSGVEPDAQRGIGKTIFGGGLLLSDDAAERHAAAGSEQQPSEQQPSEQHPSRAAAHAFELSDRERGMVEMLGGDDGHRRA